MNAEVSLMAPFVRMKPSATRPARDRGLEEEMPEPKSSAADVVMQPALVLSLRMQAGAMST